jgi:hypothetical protein
MVEEHHEADDEENQTNGHEELFAVMTGHAVFMVDGEEIDAPAGTIVFVRDPALLRAARATADDTAIFMVGGPAGVPYTVSRWEDRSRNRATPGIGWDGCRRVECFPIDSSLGGLQLFSAWVHEPDEPEEDPPTGLRSARH